MRLKDILAGTRAIHVVPLPIMKAPTTTLVAMPGLVEQRADDTAAARPEQAPPAVPAPQVGLRVLTGEETGEVCEKAWAWAKAKGATGPTEDDPIYSIAVKVYTCAIACVDPDEPRALFFGDSLEQAAENLRASELVGRDGIVYLAEQHESWQEICAPQIARMAPEQFMQKVGEVAASPDGSPFLELQPGLRVIFARTMACTLLDLLTRRSEPGSSSADDGTTPRKPASDGEAEP